MPKKRVCLDDCAKHGHSRILKLLFLDVVSFLDRDRKNGSSKKNPNEFWWNFWLLLMVNCIGWVYLAKIPKIMFTDEEIRPFLHFLNIQQVLHEIICIFPCNTMVSGIKVFRNFSWGCNSNVFWKSWIDNFYIIQLIFWIFWVWTTKFESDDIRKSTDSSIRSPSPGIISTAKNTSS